MNKCSMLLFNDKVIHKLKETSCNVSFTKHDFQSTHYVSAMHNNESGDCGIFIHTDCWNLNIFAYNSYI